VIKKSGSTSEIPEIIMPMQEKLKKRLKVHRKSQKL